jgi:hypothetical protein
MAQTQTLQVRVDAAINAAPTLKSLRELKQLQKEVVAGSDDFKRIQGRINDIGDAAKTAKGQSEDWIDTLAGAPGVVGSLGRGLDSITSSTNKFGLALKATGIGLIVALVGQLVAAFTSNEKAMKKLEPIMIAFEQILGGIFAALEPVFNLLIDLAIQALPTVIKGFGILYSTIFGFVTFIKETVVGAGKLLVGLFTFDTDMIKDGIKQVTSSVSTGVQATQDAYSRYEQGTKETTKTQKKNLEEAAAAHAKYLESTKANYEQQEKLRQADLDKAKAIAMSQSQTEEERLAIEKKYAEDSYNSKKKLLEQTQALYPKNSKEYKDYTAQLTALEAEYINKKTEFTNKEKELATKAFQDLVKLKQQENKQIVDDLTLTYNKQKELYGENSKEARKAQDEIYISQQKAVNDELALYEKRKQEVGNFTKEEAARVEELKNQQKSLTNTIEIENNKRIKADREAAIKKLDDDKKANDEKFNKQIEAASSNFQLQQQLLADKLKQDEEYFKAQQALYAGNQEKLDELDRARTANLQQNAQQQEQIRKAQVDLQLRAADAVIGAFGAETAAGKAALLAKQVILAKELVLEAKRTLTFAKGTFFRSKAAIAEGSAQTAKVGFPQNIPLLILYAAQAVGIIKAVIDATKAAKEGGGETGGNETPAASGTAVPKPRGLAFGGMVTGPGSGRSDLIPAMLSNGESVINAQSTAAFRPLLSAINEIGGGRRFADGGLAISSISSDTTLSSLQTMMNTQQVPIKTYVVSSDMTNQQMLDRNIKDRSTL